MRGAVPESIDEGVFDTLTLWDTDTEDENYRRRGEATEVTVSVHPCDVFSDAMATGGYLDPDHYDPDHAPHGTGLSVLA